MRKLILLPLVILLFPFLVRAQSGFTSVTGQVKDANSVPYANCAVTANFVDATGVTTRAATINGSPIPSRTIQSACDANGNFTIVVEDSAVVVPLGTTWQFTFSYTQHTTGLPNPAGQPQAPSFTYTAPICPNVGCITGATISITSAISPLVPPVQLPGGIAAGALGNLTKYGASQQVIDSGIAANNVPTLNGNNALSGNNTFKSGIPWIDVSTYGAKCDGVTDDKASIQNSINAVPTSGGIINFPISATGCLINSSLTISSPHITFQGGSPDAGAFSGQTFGLSATRLTWGGGASPMLIVTSSTSTIIDYDTIQNLSLDCAGTATFGIQLLSTWDTTIRNVGVRECATADIEMETLNGTGQPIDTNNVNAVKAAHVENVSLINTLTVGGRTGIPIRLTSGSVDLSNTNYSVFENVRATYSSNPCISILNGDSNTFFQVSCNWSGTGSPSAGVLLDASLAGSLVNDNYFYGLDPGVKGVIQQNGATTTEVYGYIRDNGAPQCSYSSGTFMVCLGHSFWQISQAVVSSSSQYTSTGLSSFATASNGLTLTAAQMIGTVVTTTNTMAANYQVDTAANICTANSSNTFRPPGGNGTTLGPAYDWWIRNKSGGANTITVTTNTGITLDPSSTFTVAQNTIRHFKMLMLNCAAGAEAVYIFGMESGTF